MLYYYIVTNTSILAMNTKSSPSHLKAVARHQAKSERWTASATDGTKRQQWLKSAKSDINFVADFWAWLEKRYDSNSQS